MPEVFFLLGAPSGLLGVQATPKVQLTVSRDVTQLTVVEDVVQFSRTEALK